MEGADQWSSCLGTVRGYRRPAGGLLGLILCTNWECAYKLNNIDSGVNISRGQWHARPCKRGKNKKTGFSTAMDYEQSQFRMDLNSQSNIEV